MSALFNIQLGVIPIITLAIIIVVVVYDNISRNYYGTCPKCGKEFKASLLQLIFTVHVFYKFYLKCPHCNKWGMKSYKYDKE